VKRANEQSEQELIAGHPEVNAVGPGFFGTLGVEVILGRSMRKEHSAVDWSRRPLPQPWLEYAALDVEVLLELREVLGRELEETGKAEWARQEFEHLIEYVPPARLDPWRRTSGIHKAKGPIETTRLEEDGYKMHIANNITFGFGKKSTRLTPDGPIVVEVAAELWGMGFQYTFFPIPDEAISIQAQTPVDEDHCDMFQSVLVLGEEGFDPAAEPEAMAAARVREQFVQIERDIPIWENMRYIADAPLSPQEEGPMKVVRRWAQRFYPADA